MTEEEAIMWDKAYTKQLTVVISLMGQENGSVCSQDRIRLVTFTGG